MARRIDHEADLYAALGEAQAEQLRVHMHAGIDEAENQVGDVLRRQREDRHRRELHDWLHTPLTASGYRDDLYFKLLAGARAGREALEGVISREREQLLAELHALGQLAAREPDPLCVLLNQGAALQVGDPTTPNTGSAGSSWLNLLSAGIR